MISGRLKMVTTILQGGFLFLATGAIVMWVVTGDIRWWLCAGSSGLFLVWGNFVLTTPISERQNEKAICNLGGLALMVAFAVTMIMGR